MFSKAEKEPTGGHASPDKVESLVRWVRIITVHATQQSKESLDRWVEPSSSTISVDEVKPESENNGEPSEDDLESENDREPSVDDFLISTAAPAFLEQYGARVLAGLDPEFSSAVFAGNSMVSHVFVTPEEAELALLAAAFDPDDLKAALQH
jgi:hypothetical protein